MGTCTNAGRSCPTSQQYWLRVGGAITKGECLRRPPVLLNITSRAQVTRQARQRQGLSPTAQLCLGLHRCAAEVPNHTPPAVPSRDEQRLPAFM